MTQTGHTHNSEPDEAALMARLDAPLAALALPPHPEQTPAPVFPTVLRRDGAGRVWIVDRLGHRIFIYHATGPLLAAPGGLGSGSGQFHYPADVAVSPAGRAFITDMWNHRVQVLDTAAGQFVQTLGGRGRDPGRLLEPCGVVCADGLIFVSERENHRLSIFREDGTFEQARSLFAGMRQALTCPGGLAVAGPYLLVLAEPRRVLVLHRETLFCENCITLEPGTAPAALYAAADDLFVLATLSGELLLYGIDGTLVWTKRPVAGAPPLAPGGGPALLALASDIEQRRYLPMRVELPGVSLPHLIRTLPQTPHHGDTHSQTFVFTTFESLLADAAAGDGATTEALPALAGRFPALRMVHEKMSRLPGLPPEIKSRIHGQTLHLAETADMDPPVFRRAAIRCATATADGRVIAAFTPAGLAEISPSGMRVLNTAVPADCAGLAALPDGTLLALATARGGLAIQRLNPDGSTLHVLTGPLPPACAAAEPAFCVRDENSFLLINPDTSRVEIHSLNHTPDDPRAGLVPGMFEEPCAVACDAARGTVFVLQRNGRINAVTARGEFLWRAAPQLSGEFFVASGLAFLPGGRLFAVMRPIDPRNHDYSALAQLNPDTGRTVRTLDVFSDTDTDEAPAFENPAPPLARGPGGLWVLDRLSRTLLGFDPGTAPARM